MSPYVNTLKEFYAKGMTGARSDEELRLIEQAVAVTQLKPGVIKVFGFYSDS